jgi:energy-coupling factor transporter ATP-binding protein EcfA2
MDYDYWHKQTVEKPLSPDLLWSRPENKRLAGKLLIVGGSGSGFSKTAKLYAGAIDAGAGSIRVLMPDFLQKTVANIFPAAKFLPSTPSGSFARSSLAELLFEGDWADGVLIGGDLGQNSETAVLLETFVNKYFGQLTLLNDSLDYFIAQPELLLKRPNTLLVLDLKQLQGLVRKASLEPAITSKMDFLHFIEALHIISHKFTSNIITLYQNKLVVAVDGKVSTTKTEDSSQNWPFSSAASAATWWLQNPSKTFESLSTAVVTLKD